MSASLAQVHAILQTVRRSAPDRRKFRRIDLPLNGRLMDETGAEHECRTIDVSPGDARLACPVTPDIGAKLIVYLARIGRVEATVVRRLDDGVFAIQFQTSTHKREKIAEILIAALCPGIDVEGNRRETRYEGTGELTVELEDGGVLHCEILDFSLVGVAVRTARPRPLIGAWVKVGNQHGRVSRYIENGFAVDFQARPGA